ncbi:Metallo-dependent phosphatase-like protein [Thelonectria olida]|uniref:Metallo-dependent phosphatase-like protein n=1 Tax=Thelonectria olida TaxID=1576542 RepID=A0A9P8WB90_9HYPO|nr:Metallo-dependent phosphatase-like protein [Thelonectria olida]
MDKLQRLSQFFTGPPKPNGTPCGRTVQIMSDLHLELNRQYATFDFEVKAPLLVLGGDIGRLVDYEPFLGFLARQTARFERVFLILGNHEFYEMSYDDGIAKAEELEKEEVLGGKLVVMHRKRWDDQDSKLTILGCTLWSQIPPQAEDDVTLRVSDYKMIKGWSVAQHNACHAADLTFLTSTLSDLDAESEERLILVVTHHAPVIKGTSRPEHVNNPWKAAFSTDVLTRREFGKVAWWMFGHTHFTTEFQRGGIRVVANQRGYVLGFKGPTLEDTRGFDAERVVEL